jgi:hypothetical protein
MEISRLFDIFVWLVSEVFHLPADITFAIITFFVVIAAVTLVGRLLKSFVFAPIVDAATVGIYLVISTFVSMALTETLFPSRPILTETMTYARTKLLALLL